MSKYNKGDKVINHITKEKGIIIDVMRARRGRQLYRVNFSGQERDELEASLLPDCDISDPYERCQKGLYGLYSDYARKNTSFKIRSSNDSTISSLKASKTLFRAYQFKPLLKFLNSPNKRILIADEVGLGKTIEAGHIMLELKARNKLRNSLIICPKSLRGKWKDELKEKFGLNFKIYDGVRALIDDLRDKNGTVKAIINYEKIRAKKEKKDEEGKPVKIPVKQKDNDLIAFLTTETNRNFSFVLCDEAHKLRNSQTQTFKGAEVIMSQAESVIFLTATPIMISTENLFNLLYLLDNRKYFNYDVFRNLLTQNEPFVRSITAINNNTPYPKILDYLKQTQVETYFTKNEIEHYSQETNLLDDLLTDDPVYQEIISLLKGPDTKQTRARLQYLLSSMSIMNNVFSRTRKREVTTDMSQAERHPQLIKIQLTPNERKEYDKVINEYIDEHQTMNDEGEITLSQGAILGLIQRKRQISSSVYAYLNGEKQLDTGVDKYADKRDGKFENLMRIINEVCPASKLIIFAIFRPTLKYLQLRLKAEGYQTELIYGGTNDRDMAIQNFRDNPDIQILLSSEVGSEGLDMQFCNAMVNYDLPWNPMVVEQRIGRIDRFGQKSPVVNIYNLVVENSIQVEIYERLLKRIGIFENTIGDMEAILDAPYEQGITINEQINKLERQFYKTRLTQEEIDKKIEEVAQAIQNEKQNIQQLEEGLTNTLTNDAYFQDEIHRILYNKSYVTEEEIKNYLQTLISKHLPTCSLHDNKDNTYDIHIPLSAPTMLSNFLTANMDGSEENIINFKRFKNQTQGKTTITITFNQQKAYNDHNLIYLNIYHPIIQAALNYFTTNNNPAETTFSYSLPHNKTLKSGKLYYMALYGLTTAHTVNNHPKENKTLLPLVYDIGKQQIENNREIIDSLYGSSQTDGQEYQVDPGSLSPEMLSNMRYDFAEALQQEILRKKRELDIQLRSSTLRSRQQTIEYYEARIANLENSIQKYENELRYTELDSKREKEIEGAIRLMESNINKVTQQKIDHIMEIDQDPQTSITHQIISLNFIKIN